MAMCYVLTDSIKVNRILRSQFHYLATTWSTFVGVPRGPGGAPVEWEAGDEGGRGEKERYGKCLTEVKITRE